MSVGCLGPLTSPLADLFQGQAEAERGQKIDKHSKCVCVCVCVKLCLFFQYLVALRRGAIPLMRRRIATWPETTQHIGVVFRKYVFFSASFKEKRKSTICAVPVSVPWKSTGGLGVSKRKESDEANTRFRLQPKVLRLALDHRFKNTVPQVRSFQMGWFFFAGLMARTWSG